MPPARVTPLSWLGKPIEPHPTPLPKHARVLAPCCPLRTLSRRAGGGGSATGGDPSEQRCKGVSREFHLYSPHNSPPTTAPLPAPTAATSLHSSKLEMTH